MQKIKRTYKASKYLKNVSDDVERDIYITLTKENKVRIYETDLLLNSNVTFPKVILDTYPDFFIALDSSNKNIIILLIEEHIVLDMPIGGVIDNDIDYHVYRLHPDIELKLFLQAQLN